MIKEYCFVVDKKGKQLSPTNIKNGWYQIRKQKAELVTKYPMTIRLIKEVKATEEDKSQMVLGIDIGSLHTGLAIVQECETKNKPVFKGTIEHRQDVKYLMDERRGYRRYHRQHKRYRKARFDNRASSKRLNRVAPSILQKKQAVLRVIERLKKYIKIDKIYLEDVAIDIRALTEGKKLYRWQYEKSNRLDENIRKAVIIRDKYTCKECGKSKCMLEVHHITPRRLKGADTLTNLITLCVKCHEKTHGKEEDYIERYYKLVEGKNIRFDYAQHVMQGKTYLRKELSKLCRVELTEGSYTANKRIDWGIEKSHSNDAIVVTDLNVGSKECELKDWIIKPMRKKSKARVGGCLGFKHRDVVRYTKRNGESYEGYITAIYVEKHQCNLTTFEGKVLKRYGLKGCILIWRYSKLYMF